MFDSATGLEDTDELLRILCRISGKPIPRQYDRQRRVLVDSMRDAHFFFGGKKVCLALEPDHALQTAKWISAMGAFVDLAIIPTLSGAAEHILAREVQIGDLHSIVGEFDVLVSNSHAECAAKRLGIPLYEMGFPVYKSLGYTSKIMSGYRGMLLMVNEMANLLMKRH